MAISKNKTPSNSKNQKMSEAQQVDESVPDRDTASKETMAKNSPTKSTLCIKPEVICMSETFALIGFTVW